MKTQEKKILDFFGRKSKSPEPSSKMRKLSVNEVSPPVPKRRKKKTNTDNNSSQPDVNKSLSYLDVSDDAWQQPIEQKDHWGLPPGMKANDGRIGHNDLPNAQMTSSDHKTKGIRAFFIFNPSK